MSTPITGTFLSSSFSFLSFFSSCFWIHLHFRSPPSKPAADNDQDLRRRERSQSLTADSSPPLSKGKRGEKEKELRKAAGVSGSTGRLDQLVRDQERKGKEKDMREPEEPREKEKKKPVVMKMKNRTKSDGDLLQSVRGKEEGEGGEGGDDREGAPSWGLKIQV